MIDTILYMAGDPVPREWFTKLDNVASMKFLCPCLVSTTEDRRTIRKANPPLDGSMVLFSHVEGSNGEMTVKFDRETVIYT